MSRDAVVRIAALDVRRSPSHPSELKSQLLMGERVRILSAGRKWSKVENRADGYRGWVREWGLLHLSASEAGEWERSAIWRVGRSHLELRAGPGRGAIVTPIFWNSPVAVDRFEGSSARVRLPDGRHGWTERRFLRRADRPATSLDQVVAALLGVPYLWGGRTPLGFDCSGFVQQVLASLGTAIPRDAHEQFMAGRGAGQRRTPRKGELVFFGRPGGRMTHVGISLGRGLVAHAQGTVHVSSLIPSNPLYDRALAGSLRSFRRP